MKRHALLLALLLVALSASLASAESHFGLARLGGAVGYVSPENLDGTVGLGVFADLGRVTPEIGLEARMDYWSESQEAFMAKASMRDIALGVRGKYYFPVSSPKIRPFAGLGLGLHMLHSEVTIQDPGFGLPDMTADDSSTELGLDLGGGIAVPLTPRTDLVAETWYGIVSDASQFSLRLGLSYGVGR